MNLIYLIMSNLLLAFLYNAINCKLVRHKALVALKICFCLFKEKNMQNSISVFDLQAQLYTDG